MTKQEYLKELQNKLSPLPAQEREDALKFYAEYFEEAGPDKEQEVIKTLGAPAFVAAQVISRTAPAAEGGGQAPSVKRDFGFFWVMLLGILAAPIALPLMLGALIVIFVLAIVAGSLIFALLSTAAGLLFGGAAGFFASIGLIAGDFAGFLYDGGAGLVCFGTGGLLLMGAYFVLLGSLKLITKFGNMILKKENVK